MGHFMRHPHREAIERYATGNWNNTWLAEHVRDLNPTVSSYSRTTKKLNDFGGMRSALSGGKQELKFFDTQINGTPGPSVIYLTTLNPIARGVTQSTRIGKT